MAGGPSADVAAVDADEADELLDNSEIVAEIEQAAPGNSTAPHLPEPEVETLSALSMPQMRKELLSIRVLLAG